MSKYRIYQLRYILVDVLSALAVWFCFLLFRWLVYDGRLWGLDILIPAFNFYRPILLYPLACVGIYYLSGYYLRPFKKSFSKELLKTFWSSVAIVAVSFFAIIVNDEVSDYHRYTVCLLVLFLLQFVLSYVPRLLIHLFDNRHSVKDRVYTLNSLSDIPQLIEQHRQSPYDEVLISFDSSGSESDIYTAINQLYPMGVNISIAPRIYDMLTGAARIQEVEDTPKIRVSDHKMPDYQVCIKRAFDICVSLMVMIVLSPLYVLLAVLVKCSSEGTILYRQERIGFHGLPFDILKFRTMYMDAETEAPQLSSDNDPRITSIGHWMRKYRLDELPQMWNVLCGEMSIVGPRPERAYFIDKIQKQAPYYCLLYRIRPGLTSWGPIKVGYTDTIEKMIDRLNYDIVYMENMSLQLDAKILFHTTFVLIDGKGK